MYLTPISTSSGESEEGGVYLDPILAIEKWRCIFNPYQCVYFMVLLLQRGKIDMGGVHSGQKLAIEETWGHVFNLY